VMSVLYVVYSTVVVFLCRTLTLNVAQCVCFKCTYNFVYCHVPVLLESVLASVSFVELRIYWQMHAAFVFGCSNGTAPWTPKYKFYRSRLAPIFFDLILLALLLMWWLTSLVRV
jgi:hypothetical protein